MADEATAEAMVETQEVFWKNFFVIKLELEIKSFKDYEEDLRVLDNILRIKRRIERFWTTF